MWIAGRATPRDKEDKHKLAAALGVAYDELFSEVDRLRREQAREANVKAVQTKADKRARAPYEYVSKIGYIKHPVNDWARNGKKAAQDGPTCRRGQHYITRMSSDVVTDRCCVNGVCLVRGK